VDKKSTGQEQKRENKGKRWRYVGLAQQTGEQGVGHFLSLAHASSPRAVRTLDSQAKTPVPFFLLIGWRLS
jgi:hypothetical protein